LDSLKQCRFHLRPRTNGLDGPGLVYRVRVTGLKQAVQLTNGNRVIRAATGQHMSTSSVEDLEQLPQVVHEAVRPDPMRSAVAHEGDELVDLFVEVAGLGGCLHGA
jgi:hypothetical protein